MGARRSRYCNWRNVSSGCKESKGKDFIEVVEKIHQTRVDSHSRLLEGLSKEGFRGRRVDLSKRKVNHEKCWIDSETGFTTNVIEGEWRPLKEAKCIPKQSYNEKSITPYLLVVIWRRLHNANLFDRLLYAIRNVPRDFAEDHELDFKEPKSDGEDVAESDTSDSDEEVLGGGCTSFE